MAKFISLCSSHILEILAIFFANSLCFGKLYEPKLPKELQEQDN